MSKGELIILITILLSFCASIIADIVLYNKFKKKFRKP